MKTYQTTGDAINAYHGAVGIARDIAPRKKIIKIVVAKVRTTC